MKLSIEGTRKWWVARKLPRVAKALAEAQAGEAKDRLKNNVSI